MNTNFSTSTPSALSGQVIPPGPIQALLLDDDAYDRTRIRRYTEKSGLTIELEEANSISRMADMMDAKSYDLVMVDYRLAEGTGLDALDIIRQQGLNKDAAIIMITGDDQSQTAVSAFRQGCHDFIVKTDLSPVVLQTSVEGALLRSREAQSHMHDLSRHMRNHMQQAIADAIDDHSIQDALSHSMRQAANSAGLNFDTAKMYDLESYLQDDEFIFKH